ncbi:MAG: aryl-sulfate sulfotransferase [Candidatus Hodarchaeota archaeon]
MVPKPQLNHPKEKKLEILPNQAKLENIETIYGNFLINVTSRGEAVEGYNLFQVGSKNRTTNKGQSFVFITDMNGSIIKNSSEILGPPHQWINSTTIMLLRKTYTVRLWNVYTDNVIEIALEDIDLNDTNEIHHDIEYNPITETFLTLNYHIISKGGNNYRFDTILEYNKTGHLIWSLNTWDFVSHTQWCPFKDTTSYGEIDIIDITHGNTLFWDVEEDIIYYNARNINTFYKINHTNSKVIWGLGEYGNFTLFNINGVQRQNLFYHAHALEKVNNDTFILFDNDMHNQTKRYNCRSRILELKINETTMTANESWSWIAPPEYYCSGWGDADRLPNNNRLGTFGTYKENQDIGARLVEVNENGEIVWELNFPNNKDFVYGVVRMERFRFSPILDSPSDVMALLEDNITITWQTWYNFRTKMRMMGSYKVYLDDKIIENGTHTFDKFWRPTELSVNLEALEKGNHNLTLVIADEGGHITTDIVNITVKPLIRTPAGELLNIEKGQSNSTIEWRGAYNQSLMCNITLNNSLLAAFRWNNSVTLGLNTLNPGNYNITLELFNGTELFLKDSFRATIYPSSPPLITFFPANQSIIWNESLVLSWDLFDVSPSIWNILVNDSSKKSGTWAGLEYQLGWDIPRLNEGTYNITLIVCDILGYKTLRTTWLIVLPPSPPIIAAVPQQNEFWWRKGTVSLIWEAHGGINWTLWKNRTVIHSGEHINNYIRLQIDWHSKEWLPGVYNLTLQVVDSAGGSATNTIWIHIVFEYQLGDPYANAVVVEASLWYFAPENALGIPDGNYSLIFLDYGNGHLTMDMGENEEIIDGEGVDFTVIVQEGNYTVYVSNETTAFTYLGRGSSNTSFDLASIGFTKARYVRIEYYSGVRVELDAIVASNYNLLEDTDPPQISDLADFWIWENQTQVTLTWNVSDATPWNYSLWVDGVEIVGSSWDGSAVSHTFDLTNKTGQVQITLVLYDYFDNRAEDTISIVMRPLLPLSIITSIYSPSATITSTSYSLFALLCGITLLMIRNKYRNRKFKDHNTKTQLNL